MELKLETKEKDCQKLEDELRSLSKQIEKCKVDLKKIIKYEGSSNTLDEMLSKQKISKDIASIGYEEGQCSTSKNWSKKEIHFASSSENGNRQTFIVRIAPTKNIYLNTTANNVRTLATTTRKNGVDKKWKGKLNEDGFSINENTRRKCRRSEYVAGYKIENKRKSNHVTIANEQPKTNHKRRGNGVNKPARSPHTC